MKTILLLFLLSLSNFIVSAQGCIIVTDSCGELDLNYCGPWELSKGIYRIPYRDGTEIKITNDHFNHCPRGRIDMGGESGDVDGEYKIAAAADGWIRAIVENHNVQCNCKTSSCENNYVWIEHPNGEWTKYTHMKQNSVGNAGRFVDEFVTAGTTLGNEGNVGCASGNHLHFEVAQPVDTNILIFSESGGYIDDAIAAGLAKNMIPVICGISGNVFERNENYIADDCPASCVGFLVVPETVSIGEYEVVLDDDDFSNTVDFTITAYGVGLFQAANSITLKPSFEVQYAGSFEARIGVCDESPLKSEPASEWNHDEESFQLRLYPNPADQLTRLQFHLPFSGNLKIHLKDVMGRILFAESFRGLENISELGLNLPTLAKGVYLMEVSGNAVHKILPLAIN